MRIDHTRDIQTGANSSKTTIYIDRDIPQHSRHLKDKAGRPANLWKYLSVHETEEANAMARGVPYPKAHKDVATVLERKAVERDGVSWQGYTHEIDGYLAKTERKKTPLPRDVHAPEGKGCYKLSNR